MLNKLDRSKLQALLEVIEALGGVPLDAKLQFLLGRKGSLGGVTPLEALERGNLEKVRDVALAFADNVSFEPSNATLTGKPVDLED